MTNLNPIANTIATLQGVEIGSPEYNAAGLLPYASQTGGHRAYGWRFDHLIDDDFARAAIVNALSRPLYYEEEDYRQPGYNIACRPVGWVPEEANDLANGRKNYPTSKGNVSVSSPDVQHFWLNPLWAVIDTDSQAPIRLMGHMTVPAAAVAKLAVRHYLRSLAGILREVGPYLAGGRATARILDVFNKTRKRQLFADKEGVQIATVITEWIEDYALPQLETAPGVRETQGQGVCRWIQECGWMLVPLYEAEQSFDGYSDLSARFKAIRERVSQWMLDIDQIAGGKAKWYNLRITPAMLTGAAGKPLDSLIGAIDADDVTGPDDYTLWSVAAADVAQTTHPSQQAAAFYAGVKQKALSNAKPSEKVWLVDRNRDWIS